MGCSRRLSSKFSYHRKSSADDTLYPQRPFQPFQRLAPQPPVAALPGQGRAGRSLSLAPQPQDTGMHEVDPALPVQLVEALHHVVRLAGAHNTTLICRIASAFAPRHQCRHGPEPGLLGVAERLATTQRAGTVVQVDLAVAGLGTHTIVSFFEANFGTNIPGTNETTGCKVRQANLGPVSENFPGTRHSCRSGRRLAQTAATGGRLQRGRAVAWLLAGSLAKSQNREPLREAVDRAAGRNRRPGLTGRAQRNPSDRPAV